MCTALSLVDGIFGGCAGPSGGKTGQAAVAGGVLDERWRWRVLSAKVLPQYSGATSLMAPQQASQLQVTLVLEIEWPCSAIGLMHPAPIVGFQVFNVTTSGEQ